MFFMIFYLTILYIIAGIKPQLQPADYQLASINIK